MKSSARWCLLGVLVLPLVAASGFGAGGVETRPDDFSVLEIAGTCMVPFLRNGQLVLVDEAVKFDALVIGDVIKFRYRGQQYAHRVIAIRRAGNGQRYLTTKGDNVSQRETVTAADFRGLVVLAS